HLDVLSLTGGFDWAGDGPSVNGLGWIFGMDYEAVMGGIAIAGDQGDSSISYRSGPSVMTPGAYTF
ncbi:hypothetical protein PJI17_32710, partial [Mycobacterium kansasii]